MSSTALPHSSSISNEIIYWFWMYIIWNATRQDISRITKLNNHQTIIFTTVIVSQLHTRKDQSKYKILLTNLLHEHHNQHNLTRGFQIYYHLPFFSVRSSPSTLHSFINIRTVLHPIHSRQEKDTDTLELPTKPVPTQIVNYTYYRTFIREWPYLPSFLFFLYTVCLYHRKLFLSLLFRQCQPSIQR